jgi:hypothetical protein
MRICWRMMFQGCGMVSEEQECDWVINLYSFRFMFTLDNIILMIEDEELMAH